MGLHHFIGDGPGAAMDHEYGKLSQCCEVLGESLPEHLAPVVGTQSAKRQRSRSSLRSGWNELVPYCSVTLLFTIQAQAGAARFASIHTAHGDVETPAFMPVGTAGTVKAVPQDILEDLGSENLGAQIILGNTYHLYLRPGHELVRKLGGLHKFMSWERALLTDSGGFQVFSLSELRKVSEEGVSFRSHLDGTSHLFTPERSMEIQIALGADMVMAFDECTEHPAERERARASMEMTLRWVRRSQDYFESHKCEVPWNHIEGASGQTQALFGIVQG